MQQRHLRNALSVRRHEQTELFAALRAPRQKPPGPGALQHHLMITVGASNGHAEILDPPADMRCCPDQVTVASRFRIKMKPQKRSDGRDNRPDARNCALSSPNVFSC